MEKNKRKIYSMLLLAVLLLPQIAFAAESGVLSIREILLSFLRWLLQIIGILALISFAISGVQYFFAAGDEKMAESAKKTIIFSVIGLVIALSGLILTRSIGAILE